MKDDKFLNYYPKRLCEFEMNNDIVTVLYKRKKVNLFEKVFLRKNINKPYKIDLDETGSFIWQFCDGKNSVKLIVDECRNHFGEKIELWSYFVF